MKKTLTLAVALTCAAICLAQQREQIVVHNAAEFVAALGSDRDIIIDSKAPLMITPQAEKLAGCEGLAPYDYYSFHNPAGVSFYSEYDGVGLSVTGFSNFSIRSKAGQATLLATPRYVDVLTFERCSDFSLENITMGHTEGGYCTCGVLALKACERVTITGCDLFGCGTEGIVLSYCSGVKVTDTDIHDCTYHTMHLEHSGDVSFAGCTFRDNREYSQINISDCYLVTFSDCRFERLQGPLFDVRSKTSFVDCTFDYVDMNPDDNVIFTQTIK